MRFATGIAILAATLLGACVFEQQTAGGEDFPNTLEPLGKAAAEPIANHTQWDQFQNIPAVPNVQSSDTLAQPAPTAKPALAKIAASDSATWDLRDTALAQGGVAREYVVKSGLLKIERDTLVYRWNAAFGDSVPGSAVLLEVRGRTLTYLTLRLLVYRYLNLDSSGALDQADFTEYTVGFADSAVHILHIKMLAGPDGDLATLGDNLWKQYEFLRVRGGTDTLEWTRVVDADGDGLLWSGGDSGMVDLRQDVESPALRPQDLHLSLNLRAKVYHKGDSAIPLAYTETNALRNGVTTVFTAKGVHVDSLLIPGDTAVVTFDQIYPPDADRVESYARYRILLASQPWHFADNALIRFHAENTWRAGVIRSAIMDFTPDSMVVSGQLQIAGSFTLSVVYDDGGTGAVTGTYRNHIIAATLHQNKAGLLQTFSLSFDANGKLLTQSLLPP